MSVLSYSFKGIIVHHYSSITLATASRKRRIPGIVERTICGRITILRGYLKMCAYRITNTILPAFKRAVAVDKDVYTVAETVPDSTAGTL
jgi:hypothetical protein